MNLVSSGVLRMACVFSFAVALSACGFPKSGPVPPPVSPDTLSAAKIRHPEANEQTLTLGRDLFVQKCNRCHGHPDVTYKTAEEWPAVVKRMASKADLDAKQEEAVLQFVVASRQLALGAVPAPTVAPSSTAETPSK